MEHLARSGNPGQVKPLGEHLHGSTFMAMNGKDNGLVSAMQTIYSHVQFGWKLKTSLDIQNEFGTCISTLNMAVLSMRSR